MLPLLMVAGYRWLLRTLSLVMGATVMVLVDCCGHCDCSSFLIAVDVVVVVVVGCCWLLRPLLAVVGCRGLCRWLPRFVSLVAAVCVVGSCGCMLGCCGCCRWLPWLRCWFPLLRRWFGSRGSDVVSPPFRRCFLSPCLCSIRFPRIPFSCSVTPCATPSTRHVINYLHTITHRFRLVQNAELR